MSGIKKRERIYRTVNGTKKEMHRLAHEIETGAYIDAPNPDKPEINAMTSK
ncbi:hypothetical protein MWH25_12070 [Natroniella acetigena]|uniref:hypothetical protein n=1 Tax=Natroniella acetigena TaxID=52004 RepID=UPI00200AFB6D|nr:hypothetical protein [Natroniella acetigena]MCK8828464.1 hypothetical protein [Natroniella acetigena]